MVLEIMMYYVLMNFYQKMAKAHLILKMTLYLMYNKKMVLTLVMMKVGLLVVLLVKM